MMRPCASVLALAALLCCGGAVAQPVVQAAAQPAPALDAAALRARAEAGDAQAAWRLGLKYRNGDGVPANALRAVRLLEVAAQARLPAAMFTLSNMLAAGEGSAKDAAGARRWLEAAAALGHPAALQQLALTETDPRRAELLMRQAAHALQHRGTGE